MVDGTAASERELAILPGTAWAVCAVGGCLQKVLCVHETLTKMDNVILKL